MYGLNKNNSFVNIYNFCLLLGVDEFVQYKILFDSTKLLNI